MKWILCCLFALILASYAQADIYKYEDSDAINHFTYQPTDDRFKIFAPDPEKSKAGTTKGRPRGKEKEPIADRYLFNATSSDGTVWAVRTTNQKQKYFWYMGLEGKKLVTVKGKVVYVGAAKFYLKDNDVMMSQFGEEAPLVRGTMGYYCYTYTMSHAGQVPHQ